MSNRPPIITITNRALERMKELLDKRGKSSLGIRISLKTKGCSGLSYAIEYADEEKEFDEMIVYENFKVFIDPKAVLHILGTEMNYVEEEMHSGFTFSNPNEKGRCGCGKSFHI
jgi:iron-sulfur cluster assembly protein